MAESRRGGRRAGRPGASYTNRTDLAMGPRTAPLARIPGQTYGAQTSQIAAQKAGQEAAATIPQPAQIPVVPVDLNAPSERPYEPVTHGLAYGPGAGPEALGQSTDDALALLRAFAQKARAAGTDSPELWRIIMDEDARRAV